MRRFLTSLMVLTMMLTVAVPSYSAAYLYSGKRKRVNCGILVVNGSQPLSAGLDENGFIVAGGGVGDLFYLLERRFDVKPAGWTLENPLSPYGASGKQDPVYWRVDLKSSRNLSRMHLLYLPGEGTVTLDPQDREKLRRFVDNGGVLWIDNAGAGVNALNFGAGQGTFFLQNLSFENGATVDIPVNRHHPLLSSPYWLTELEVAYLGANWGKSYCRPGYDPGRTWKDFASPPTVFDVLLPIVNNEDRTKPSVAANAYGSGRIVATANFVGRGCYSYYPYDMPNLKFAYNVISWAASWTHLRKDPRHSGASIDTVGGTKLLDIWSLPAPPASEAETAPVIYKNIVFYASGSKLYALDLMPQEDLDQDGNPDDGLPGIPTGMDDNGQDIVWMWPDPNWPEQNVGTLSTPTVVTAQDPADPGATIEAVLLASTNGNVYMLKAFPYDSATGKLRPITESALPTASWAIGVQGSKPFPPLYINGWIYAVGGNGHLYGYNPSLDAWASANPNFQNPPSSKWELPTPFGPTQTAEPRGGLSFGFVRNETNGAIAGMLYYYTGVWSTTGTSDPGVEQNDHLCGAPVVVANDRLRLESTNKARNVGEFRISYSGHISSGPPVVVTWMRPGPGGQMVDISDRIIEVKPNCGVTGELVVCSPMKIGSLVVTGSEPFQSDDVLYATYTLDYATPGFAQSLLVRQPLEPRSNNLNQVPPTKFSGTGCLGLENMVYVGGARSSGDIGGSVYGIRNDGYNHSTKWHYLLHGPVDAPPVSTSTVPVIPATIYAKDDRGTADPSDDVWVPMVKPQPCGSPAVAGDKVFVTVTGESNGPKGALLCFKASPDCVIRVTENGGYGEGGNRVRVPKRLVNSATNRPMTVKVWQPNVVVPATGLTVQPLIEAVPVPSDMVDYEKGTITFKDFERLKLRSGIQVLSGIFSTSLPVWVFLDNVEVPVDFSTWGPSVAFSAPTAPIPSVEGDSVDLSGWHNLLWYYVPPDYEGAPCTGIHSSPVVIGNTVYFVTDEGVLYALNAETGESHGGPTSQKPLWQKKISSGFYGSGTNASLAGANGVLLVPAPDGLHAYANPNTLVADNNRIVELDGAGEISWSVNSVSWPIAIPTSPNQNPPRRSGPISKPARARYIDSGDLLIVNTGANQVFKMDKSGTIGVERRGNKYFRWMYDRFADPKHLLRPGQPLELRSPTDAYFWQEIEPDGTGRNVLVYHCLVADSANHRVLDLVYRVDVAGSTNLMNSEQDPNTGFYLPELNWVTLTDSVSEKYVFDCIQLVTGPNGVADVWAAISNYATGTNLDLASPSNAEDKGQGGAIVAIRYRVPGQGGAKWDYSTELAGKIVARCDRVIDIDGERPLASPRYFQVIDGMDGANLVRRILFCDNRGVFLTKPIQASGPPQIDAALTDTQYRGMKRDLIREVTKQTVSAENGIGVPLQAFCATRLMNENWLITNSYSGTDKNGPSFRGPSNKFTGEVFEYDPDERKIVWSTPAIVIPSVPDDPEVRQQRLENSSVLQQPRSALRQY